MTSSMAADSESLKLFDSIAKEIESSIQQDVSGYSWQREGDVLFLNDYLDAQRLFLPQSTIEAMEAEQVGSSVSQVSENQASSSSPLRNEIIEEGASVVLLSTRLNQKSESQDDENKGNENNPLETSVSEVIEAVQYDGELRVSKELIKHELSDWIATQSTEEEEVETLKRGKDVAVGTSLDMATDSLFQHLEATADEHESNRKSLDAVSEPLSYISSNSNTINSAVSYDEDVEKRSSRTRRDTLEILSENEDEGESESESEDENDGDEENNAFGRTLPLDFIGNASSIYVEEDTQQAPLFDKVEPDEAVNISQLSMSTTTQLLSSIDSDPRGPGGQDVYEGEVVMERDCLEVNRRSVTSLSDNDNLASEVSDLAFGYDTALSTESISANIRVETAPSTGTGDVYFDMENVQTLTEEDIRKLEEEEQWLEKAINERIASLRSTNI